MNNYDNETATLYVLLPVIIMLLLYYPFVHTTVKPPNKGHFGNNINSSLLSFVERLSSSRRFKMY